MAAGLCPDPLGELTCSPRLPSRNKGGPTSKGREREGSVREERGKGRENLLQGVRGDWIDAPGRVCCVKLATWHKQQLTYFNCKNDIVLLQSVTNGGGSGQYIENIADIDIPVSVLYRHFRYRFLSIYRYRISDK